MLRLNAKSALHLREELRRALRRMVEQSYPKEACGLLLGTGDAESRRVMNVREAGNLSVERAGDRYELDPQDFLAADREARAAGMDILGIWHSHPDHPARPSETDRAAAWPEWSYLIVSVGRAGVQEMRSWRLNGGDFEEEAIEP